MLEGDKSDWIIKSYLEEHYVPVAIDADTEEGQVLASRHNTLGWYPTLFLFDQEGSRKAFTMVESDQTESGDLALFLLMNEIGDSGINRGR